MLAAVTSTLIWRDLASGALSPTRVPSFAVPLRWIAPVAISMLSSRVDLPLR